MNKFLKSYYAAYSVLALLLCTFSYAQPPPIQVEFPATSSLLVQTGQTVTFFLSSNVIASVTPPTNTNGLPPPYQWLKNGTIIPGATNTSLSIAAVTFADTASYSAYIFGDHSRSETPPVTVTVASFAGGLGPPGPGPVIRSNPDWQYVHEGSNAVFTVEAENQPPLYLLPTLTYQWARQGPESTNFVPIPGATSSTFELDNVTTNGPSGPAYFQVTVTGTNGVGTVSVPAGLIVWTTNSPLTAWGTPIRSQGGSSGCLPNYAGYVNYFKSPQNGYGWTPNHASGNTTHFAADNTRVDTKVETSGDTNDYLCNGHIGANTHSGSPPPEDHWWVFTIYFPNNVPTSSYPITLTGFN
jgi:hypothetical protein